MTKKVKRKVTKPKKLYGPLNYPHPLEEGGWDYSVWTAKSNERKGKGRGSKMFLS